MDEHNGNRLHELEAELRAIGADIDAKMAAGRYGVEQYDDIKRLMAAMEAVTAEHTRATDELRGNMNELRERVTDMEAADFATKCEHEIDLARWRDGIAASVGYDLEEIADRLMAAIEANRRGEDVDAALFDVHGDVLTLMADLLTMNPEDEGA